MTEIDFDAVDRRATQQLAEARADEVILSPAEDAAKVVAQKVREVFLEDPSAARAYETVLCFLAALADRDYALEVIEAYVEDESETWVVDQDRPQIRLALAAAYLRKDDLERAQRTFFEAGISGVGFREEHLPRINGFITELTRYHLRALRPQDLADSF